jgi:hypothetical protein
MMNHTQILKNAWKILWSYKALWIFGVILALTSGSFPGPRGNQMRYQFNQRDFRMPLSGEINRAFSELGRLFNQTILHVSRGQWIGVAIALICLLVLLIVLFRIGYYVSQTALIRMVDKYEESGEKVSWRQGFRFGWSRQAWRLFLIDLVIYVPLVLGIIVLFGCAVLPVILSSTSRHAPTAPGIIATIGLVFLVIFAIVVVGVALSLVINIIRRVCVLEGVGTLDAIHQGWHLVRHNFKDVFVMWLILVGLTIGYFVVLLPVVLLVLGVAVLLGGGVGFLTHSLIRLAISQWSAVVTSVLLGGTIFFLILALPLLFLGGLFETYISTSWTLAYRELKVMKTLTPETEVIEAPAEEPKSPATTPPAEESGTP